ncbi:microvitellogenin-like [Bombyx mandarina]|uniref:Microvitellogenin-like n=1 Tax=Bombyx mandarina TaxID=7092 RepID=A0A6J2JLY3_BOMMA|nr:microvitellogenin-like [Bombyx mandarina]
MGSTEAIALLMCMVLAASANSIVDKEVTDSAAAVSTDESTSVTSTVSSEIIEAAASFGNVTNGQSPPISVVIKRLENELYNLVVSKDYDKAAERTKVLYKAGWDRIIKKVVDILIDEGRTEIFDYAYRLYVAKGRLALRSCFPVEVRLSESTVFVKLINKRDGYAALLDDNADFHDDHRLLAHRNTTTRFEVTWKFVSFWTGDKLYFKLRPINEALFLKLGTRKDEDGDRTAYGSPAQDTNRHLWYVKPVRYNGELLVYIINREYDMLLKLGQSTKYDGYRIGYGHSKMDFTPDIFAWHVEVL